MRIELRHFCQLRVAQGTVWTCLISVRPGLFVAVQVLSQLELEGAGSIISPIQLLPIPTFFKLISPDVSLSIIDFNRSLPVAKIEHKLVVLPG